MAEYKNSQRASAESFIRRCIRKAARRTPKWCKDHPNGYSLTQNQAAVLLKLANLSMYHHPAPCHPGKALLGRTAGLCIRTVEYTLRKFEIDGFLIPVAHAKGGFGRNGTGKAIRFATDFMLDFELLIGLIEPLPTVAQGELVKLFSTYENGPLTAAQTLRATCRADFACLTAAQSLRPALSPAESFRRAVAIKGSHPIRKICVTSAVLPMTGITEALRELPSKEGIVLSRIGIAFDGHHRPSLGGEGA